MPETSWEYFVSHASEDKELIAEPLANVLQTSGFRVWYDRFTLRVGDSLRESIEAGLANSSFGIVIMSPNFLAKKWTQSELSGLWSRELGAVKVILPVWHKISFTELAARAPMLADRLAVSTDRGLATVAEELIRASFPDRLEPSAEALRRALYITSYDQKIRDREALQSVLSEHPSASDLSLFVSGRPSLLDSDIVLPAHRFQADDLCDFIGLVLHGVTGGMELKLYLLGRPDGSGEAVQKDALQRIEALVTKLGEAGAYKRDPGNDQGRPYVGEYRPLIKLTKSVLKALNGDKNRPAQARKNIHWNQPKEWFVTASYIGGRRDPERASKRNQWAANLASSTNFRLEIASYDRLCDH